MSDPSTTSVVDAGAKVTAKIVETIANPVLIFLIVITGFVLGGMIYIWHSQRTEALDAYTHLIDVCLPGKEKE
jgi:uncharacterized membrane protein AbrB (regulator of aidB expression)